MSYLRQYKDSLFNELKSKERAFMSTLDVNQLDIAYITLPEFIRAQMVDWLYKVTQALN